MEIQESGNNIILEIRINPSSGKFRFYEKSGKITLNIKSRPDKGKANSEILAGLRKLFGKDVEILKGHKSRNKTILVKDVTEQEIERVLSP